MLKSIWFLIVSIFFLPLGFGADVNLDVGFSENSAVFTYEFIFGENESIDSFSFEKPRDSKLLEALEGDQVIPVRIAGDFFILNVDNSRNKTFEVKFESKEEFKLIEEKNSFSTYVNFNFDVEKFIYDFDSSSFSKEVIEVFPRDHIFLGDGKYQWEVEEVSKDMFFLVEFSKNGTLIIDEKIQEESKYSNFFYSMVALGLLAFFGVFLYLLGYFKATKKKEKKENLDQKKGTEDSKKSIVIDMDNKLDFNDVEEDLDEIEDVEVKFNNYLEKYLTENEQEVVKVVKEYDGLAQNDILNHLPSLTKSNLSKIITKLHGKHILNRIRVGKVNKIYLGDKLNFDKSNDDSGE